MTNTFLSEMKRATNFTTTENGAVALASTGGDVLDAFASLGAMKDSPKDDIIGTFMKALNEDKILAMRLLFYIRDIRGGQGMRRVFRIIIRYLAYNKPQLIIKNLHNILYYGRGDDLWCLLHTPVEKYLIEYVKAQLEEDLEAVQSDSSCSLLGKWLPSENASSKETISNARYLMKALNLSPKKYRQMCSTLRNHINIVETKMSTNNWETIEFSTVPSKASLLYSKAFEKHCEERYINYVKDVALGKAKVNANAVFPVDIIHKAYYELNGTLSQKYLLEGMWQNLPNYFTNEDESAICVVDVSGSMYGTPIEVAMSLGLYCAEKCKGPYQNHFITFSSNPQLVEIKGDTIVEKCRLMSTAQWGMNTNLKKVFDTILDVAIKNNLNQSDIPNKLYIISDMQFDFAMGKNTKTETLIDTIKSSWAEAGYELPALIYWNVRRCDCGMFQQDLNGYNCCMVSGYSPSLFKSVIDGTEYVPEVDEQTQEVRVKQVIDPIQVMTTTLMNPRYDRVVCE